MTTVFEMLMAVSLIGIIDVAYFHLYKFRLFAQPGSVAEEVTHLARHLTFLGIVATILFVRPVELAGQIVIALFAFDVVNTAVDVVLERRSRETLGGLPSLEYLLHVLASIGVGAIAATFWWKRSDTAVFSDTQMIRGMVALVGGTVLFLVEATLFARAIGARASVSAAGLARS
jgi:hypothetical protein